MTAPRIVEKGNTVMSTIRCAQRKYLLAPTDPEIAQIFAYCLAYYAREHKITLHAAAAMSTHLHTVFTDHNANRGAFLRDLHSKIACCIRAKRGLGSQIFRKGNSQVRLLTEASVFDKIAYVIANPVAAGAVRYAKDWPGFISSIAQMESSTAISKPRHYFKDDKFPETIALRFEVPTQLGDESDAKSNLQHLVEKKEEEARDAVRKKKWTFTGAERCTKLDHNKEAKAYEVWGSLNPRFSTLGGGQDAYKKAIEKLKAFLTAHRNALAAWRDGNRKVEFPYGTYKMRVHHCARCAPA